MNSTIFTLAATFHSVPTKYVYHGTLLIAAVFAPGSALAFEKEFSGKTTIRLSGENQLISVACNSGLPGKDSNYVVIDNKTYAAFGPCNDIDARREVISAEGTIVESLSINIMRDEVVVEQVIDNPKLLLKSGMREAGLDDVTCDESSNAVVIWKDHLNVMSVSANCATFQ